MIQPYDNYSWIYCMNPGDDEPILDINDQIGLSNGSIDGTLFSKEITMLDQMGKKKINIYINSSGGSVQDGYTIFMSILRCKTPTCGYIGGIGASIAGVILQACSWRVMFNVSLYMIHNPSYKDGGSDNDPLLELIKESLMEMLRTKNLSKESLDKLMDKETWMNADEAFKLGFIDEIIDIKEIPQKNEIINFGTLKLEYIRSSKDSIINYNNRFKLLVNDISNGIKESIKIKNNISTMNNANVESLRKLLNLPNTATEKEIIDSAKISFPFMFGIDTTTVNSDKTIPNKMVNDAKDDEDDEDDEDDCHNKMDKDVVNDDDDDEMVNKDMKKEIANLKKTIESLAEGKAQSLVNKAVKDGRIKESDSKIYLNLAKKDYKSTEELINSLKINKKSSDGLDKVINKSESAKQIEEIKEKTISYVKKEMDFIINDDKGWEKINLNDHFISRLK